MIVGVVISNLLYLIVAVAVAVIGALVVVLRHRKPKSVEANVASFHRGLRALAPDQPSGPSGSGPSWGGASRRAATTPSAFKRSVTSGGDTAAEEAPAASGDDHEVPSDPPESDVETDAVAGLDQAETETEGATEGDAESAVDEDVADDTAADNTTADNTAADDTAADDTAADNTAASAGPEADTTHATPAEAPAVDPVHLTSRKRRPSPASPSRPSGESEVPTEEAGTG